MGKSIYIKIDIERLIKYIAYFIIFFIVFYFETVELPNGIKVSQVWKLPFFLAIIVYILSHSPFGRPDFVKVRYLMSLKQIINYGSFFNNIMEMFKYSMFPLLYDFINRVFKFSRNLERILLVVSQYFILTCIPFLLGIFHERVDGLSYGDFQAFTGIFGAQHAASSILSLSLFVILNHLKNNKLPSFEKFYNYFLCAVSILSIYRAFTRTGWVMCAIGIIVLYFPPKVQLKQVLKYSLIVLSFLVAGLILFHSVPEFRAKLSDQDVVSGNSIQKGSGRLIFAFFSLQLWNEGNIVQKFFGFGLDGVMDNMESNIGLRLFSHNGFIDALSANGLIGLFLMFWYLISLFKNIQKCKGTSFYRLCLAMLFIYVSFQATQGGGLFQIDLLMALTFVMMNKQRIESQSNLKMSIL